MAPIIEAQAKLQICLLTLTLFSQESVSAVSRDTVLMQVHQTVDRSSPEVTGQHDETQPGIVRSAPQAAAWLGIGRNLAMGDYWNFQHLGGASLFTAEMPANCFEEVPCNQSAHFDSQHFNSANSFTDYYSKSKEFDKGKAKGSLKATVEASLGDNVRYSAESSVNLSYASKKVPRKCYRLVRDETCAYNRAYLQPSFMHRIESPRLPIGEPYTMDKMEAWNDAVILKYGTHVTIGSIHGSEVQSLVSLDSRGEVSDGCLDSKLCFGFGWIGKAGIDFCNERKKCDERESSAVVEARTCAALGGDPDLQVHICGGEVPADIFDAWSLGGDLHASSSIYHYTFMPLHEFLAKLNLDRSVDKASMVEKAVEYSNCDKEDGSALRRWQPQGGYQLVLNASCASEGVTAIMDEKTCRDAARSLGMSEDDVSIDTHMDKPMGCQSAHDKGMQSLCAVGEFGCQCTRQCANGGVLDVNSCTCQCAGDHRHGWTGPECREEYGSCQAGAGSTNEAAAKKCVLNNKCETFKSKENCAATNVCCASRVGAKCCPHGSKCSCTWNKCSCLKA